MELIEINRSYYAYFELKKSTYTNNSREKSRYRIAHHKITILGYADDVLITDNEDDMQRLVPF